MVIETDRLILREFALTDAASFYLLNSDSEVLKHTIDKPFASVDDAKEFLKNYKNYEKDGFGRWTVVLKNSNEFIGWCGLKNHNDEFIDLGYRFLKSHWGKGYATEAGQACIQYGFSELGMSQIIGRATIENLASIRVLQKCGMKFMKEDKCDGLQAVYYQISK
ncbi:MAG: GNAT family N-acetyltransferase [Bacteroidia bacterium]